MYGMEGGGTVDICITLQVGLHRHSSLNKTSNWDHLSTTVKLFSQSVSKFIIAWFQIIMISLCVNMCSLCLMTWIT